MKLFELILLDLLLDLSHDETLKVGQLVSTHRVNRHALVEFVLVSQNTLLYLQNSKGLICFLT